MLVMFLLYYLILPYIILYYLITLYYLILPYITLYYLILPYLILRYINKYKPILSAIGTPTYNLSKFLVPILLSLTSNEFTVKDSFCFAKDIVSQDSRLYMASLDVDSLFTNIPLEETINICVDQLFLNNDKVNDLSKTEFHRLLSLVTAESYFIFYGEYYKQLDGVAMGSSLGPTLANAFLCYHEKK